MVTCFIHYTIDPMKVAEFEQYGRLWIAIVNRMGGRHHGYLLPSEGANDVGYASFTFEDFPAYTAYRTAMATDRDCQAALEYARTTQCIKRYDRSFMRPVFQ